MQTESTIELRHKLEKAEEMERYRIENPDAIKAAFDEGKAAGWSQGWQDGMKFIAQMVLACAEIHRTHPPEGYVVSLERIADFCDEARQKGLVKAIPNESVPPVVG